MKTRHSVENALRAPCEWIVATISVLVAGSCLCLPESFGLLPAEAKWPASIFFLLGVVRAIQGFNVQHYQWGLLKLKPYSLSTDEVPHSKKYLFIGRGFAWHPVHRQRLDLLTQPQYEKYRRRHPVYRKLHTHLQNCPHSRWRYLTYLPGLKPTPDVGGKPWLHGVGASEEKPLWISQSERNGHMLVLGKTRVGKTRLLSILVNQDIRNGEAIIVVDPKGDLGLLQDMYAAAKLANRLSDFRIIHAGCPEWSAKYNPLQAYTDVAEVTERITSAIDAEGEGKQFKDFAWKYLNITAICLAEMQMPITYKSLSFFVLRPKALLDKFAWFRLQQWYPDAEAKVATAIALNTVAKTEGDGAKITREDAILALVKTRMDAAMMSGAIEQLNREPLFDILEAADTSQDYYKKITASLAPVFDKINKTKAHSIFAWEQQQTEGLPVIDWETVVKRKQIIYVGLDSLTNQAMSEAIGKAIISDLVSMFGRFQRDGAARIRTVCCYFDELSEILPDSFVRLLNKAGGAGAQIIALSQTVNDIAATLGNRDKANMLIGNFSIVGMLRIANRDTAEVVTESLETIRTRVLTPTSQTHDKSSGSNNEMFTTVNSDTIHEAPSAFVTVNDLYSLPKGEMFVVTNGGDILKSRIPMPKATGHPPEVLEDMCCEVNHV